MIFALRKFSRRYPIVRDVRAANKPTRLARHHHIKNMLPSFAGFLDKSDLTNTVGQTPINRISKNFILKEEGYNLTGTIKDRVALFVLLKKIEIGMIKDNNTIVVASSGSYAMSVLAIKKLIGQYLKIRLNVIVVTPYSYRDNPGMQILRNTGLKVIREKDFSVHAAKKEDLLLYVEGVFDNAIQRATSLRNVDDYIYLDQHFDQMHVEAHQSTAKELIDQMPDLTDVVATVGTGATAMALSFFLPKTVKVHSRPTKSGDINGLNDPRKFSNFFKENRVMGYTHSFLQADTALKHKMLLKAQFNVECGNSTGAAMTIANDIVKQDPNALVAIISPSKC